MSGKAKQPVFGNFPNNALEEVEYLTKHGANKKGDKSEVHPNTAILLRFKGIVKDNSVKVEIKKVEPKQEVKKEIKPKATIKKKSVKKDEDMKDISGVDFTENKKSKK